MDARFLALVLSALAVLFASPAAAGSRPVIQSRPSAKADKVVEGAQYAFEIRCSAKAKLQDPSTFFVAKARSLFVLIAPQSPTGAEKLPADALAAVQVYSMGRDSATKQPIIVEPGSCKKDFLANGSKQISIVVTDNEIDSYSDAAFGQVLSNSFALISPLFSLLTGETLPALVVGRIANAGTVQNAVQNILTALNRGQNVTAPITDLKVGKYVFTTQYATVTVGVRPIVSIVEDQNTAFKNDLRSQINAASVKLDGSKIDTSCRGARFDIFNLGFRSTVDLAYGLTSLAAHAGFDKKDMLSCLGVDYGAAAAKADDRFWGSFPLGFRLQKSDIPAPSNEDAQPAWAKAQPIIDQLVVRLAQYTRNDPPPKPAVDALAKALAARISIVDNSTAFAIGQTNEPVDRFAAIKQFQDKGYIKFGCYAATDESTGLGVDGLTSMFLVFKADNGVNKVQIDDALVVRPQFKDGTINSLVVSDNRAWVTAALKARDYDCNGFSVVKPPSTQPRK